MNAQDVISKGQQIQLPQVESGLDFLLWFSGMFLIMVAIVAGTVFIHSRTDRKLIHNLSLVASVVAMFGYIIFPMLSDRNEKDQYAADMTEWKETVAYPYIKAQSYTDLELVSIDQKSVQYTTGIKKTHIVKYRDDQFITQTLDLPGGQTETPDIIYDVPAGETPFVRFYELDEDLGHGIDAGTYGLTAHVNKKTKK